MIYKNNWEQTKKRYLEFWEMENHGKEIIMEIRASRQPAWWGDGVELMALSREDHAAALPVTMTKTVVAMITAKTMANIRFLRSDILKIAPFQFYASIDFAVF